MQRTTLERAPGFMVQDQKGRARSLPDFLARGRLLLTFHRGMW